jgi:P27 family predicted phage terminase small subunit
MKIATFQAAEPAKLAKGSARLRPPKGLSREAARRWKTLQDEYGITDAGGLSILQIHCEALMTAREAEATLEKEGAHVTDRFGQPRMHPATTTLRDARALMLTALRQLNLDVIPKHEHAGRPAGGR